MAGRDSLPHFPAPGQQNQRPPSQTRPQGNMYQQPYQQQYNSVPGGYAPTSPVGSPQAGYQQGPPGTGYRAAPSPQQGYPQGHGAPPPGVDPQLYSLFKAADANGSGQLSERELGRALVNGDWTPFDPKTVKLMVKMFDVDRYPPMTMPTQFRDNRVTRVCWLMGLPRSMAWAIPSFRC
jgi:hypothetical protein